MFEKVPNDFAFCQRFGRIPMGSCATIIVPALLHHCHIMLYNKKINSAV